MLINDLGNSTTRFARDEQQPVSHLKVLICEVTSYVTNLLDRPIELFGKPAGDLLCQLLRRPPFLAGLNENMLCHVVGLHSLSRLEQVPCGRIRRREDRYLYSG
jgi:hypothetical protein